jgi:glycosyltransferase involved in cell wall biosynthesis
MQAPSPARGRNEPAFSLVFPTYNPGPCLDRTWHELCRFLDETPGDWEALFVCDGCTDGTPTRLIEWARLQPGRVRVLEHAPNRGKGYTVRRGLEAAQGRWRLFTDVDLAYSFDDVLRVAHALQVGADVAIASRTHPDSRVVVPSSLQGYAYGRHLQSQLFSMLVRRLLPVTQRDTQAGLKGMSARAAGLMLPHLRCNGFGFDCELLTACSRLGLTVQEVPVWVRYEDRASTTGPRHTLRMLRELWRIRRAWRRSPPAQAFEHRQAA